MSEFEKYIQEKMKIVNQKMKKLVTGRNRAMNSMVNYLLKEKGKQLRPKFLLVSASYCNRDIDVTEQAASIELLHMASLVHDDVIDNADIRRGRLSVQKKFGNKSAVYLGDYILFCIIYNFSTQYDPDIGAENNKVILDSMNKLCDGELGQNDRLFDLNISVEEYLRNIEGKTASMFEVAVKSGAILCKAEEKIVKLFGEYGKYFGVLFQINDDLMDIKGDRKDTNKPIHQDLQNGIYTLPVIFALKDSKSRKKIVKICKEIETSGITDSMAAELTSIISEAGSFDKTLELAESYYHKGADAIVSFRKCEETEWLLEALTSVYESIKQYCQE